MNKYISLLLFFATTSIVGQSITNNVVGQKIILPSKILDQEREIQVYLPKAYHETEKDYPVLYLLDGQSWFLQAVSYQQLFSEYKYTPDFIVVGINTGDSLRFGFFAQSDDLLKFLEDDVISYIDKTFRTSFERILFGWQFAGAFAINRLATKPTLFNSYLAASPIPLNQLIHEQLKSVSTPRTLFITTSENEVQVNDGVIQLVDFLKNEDQEFIRWNHQLSVIEPISSFGHRTTPLDALYQGLRFHYHDYPLLEFDRLADFEEIGGFDYVKNYYENRGEKYGVSKDIPQEGMFFLVRLGLDANHFPTFKRFMDDFISKDFVNGVNLSWGSRYAEFYIANNDTDGAEKVYEVLARRFPENARPINGLGDVFAKRGDNERAESHYRSAIELAEKNGDRRLENYKKELEELTKKKNQP